MNENQKKHYLETGGISCPYCESFEIDIRDHDGDVGYHFIHLFCQDCSKEWSETYKLVDVDDSVI